MSLRTFLREPLTIIHPATTSGLDYGDGAITTDTLGKIDQDNNRSFTPTEWDLSAETETSKWTLFLFPGVEIHSADRVRNSTGVLFEVMGVPETFYTRRGRAHHTETNLRTITGG